MTIAFKSQFSLLRFTVNFLIVSLLF